jgi:hypothetical protein
MLIKDRAIPFSLSIPYTKLVRLERVLKLAAHQGRLTSDPNRPNKLAAEALMVLCAQWEAEFRAQGLLPHEDPIAPGMASASEQIDAARLATDPDARARARAAQGFGLPPSSPDTQPNVFSEPPGIDWDTLR